MTTGRINQVANPLFVASWPPRGVGQPAAELQRSALPRRGWTVDWVSVFPSLDEGGLSVVVLGTARSLRTPLGREDFCEPTGAAVLGLSRSVRLWTRPRPPGWEDGPSDALGIEFPAGGVRSVDNYVRPSR